MKRWLISNGLLVSYLLLIPTAIFVAASSNNSRFDEEIVIAPLFVFAFVIASAIVAWLIDLITFSKLKFRYSIIILNVTAFVFTLYIFLYLRTDFYPTLNSLFQSKKPRSFKEQLIDDKFHTNSDKVVLDSVYQRMEKAIPGINRKRVMMTSLESLTDSMLVDTFRHVYIIFRDSSCHQINCDSVAHAYYDLEKSQLVFFNLDLYNPQENSAKAAAFKFQIIKLINDSLKNEKLR